MTEFPEQTYDGKLLPRHLKMFRDMDNGRIELRYWDTEITDSRLEKKPNIQIHMPTANNPFVRKIRIKNGYRSEIVCAFWDEDSIEFALSLLKRRAGVSR